MQPELSAFLFFAKLFLVASVIGALVILGVSRYLRRRSPAAAAIRFWRWFLENEEEFRDYERLPSHYPAITSQLASVDSRITFEFGAADVHRYQLTLTGPGAADLVARAPNLEWWAFVAQ